MYLCAFDLSQNKTKKLWKKWFLSYCAKSVYLFSKCLSPILKTSLDSLGVFSRKTFLPSLNGVNPSPSCVSLWAPHWTWTIEKTWVVWGDEEGIVAKQSWWRGYMSISKQLDVTVTTAAGIIKRFKGQPPWTWWQEENWAEIAQREKVHMLEEEEENLKMDESNHLNESSFMEKDTGSTTLENIKTVC